MLENGEAALHDMKKLSYRTSIAAIATANLGLWVAVAGLAELALAHV